METVGFGFELPFLPGLHGIGFKRHKAICWMTRWFAFMNTEDENHECEKVGGRTGG